MEFTQIDFIQLAVLIFGVAEVLLARSNNVLLYPTGICAIILSVYSLFKAQLYAECILQLYYLLMSIYGWRYWTSRQGASNVHVSWTTRGEWMVTIIIVVAGWFTLYWFLVMATDSQVPLWDSFVSATAWAGMWLLARRKVENWILLNISNAFAIPLLLYKDLLLLAVLTAFLFIVACVGYFDWRKLARKQSTIN